MKCLSKGKSFYTQKESQKMKYLNIFVESFNNIKNYLWQDLNKDLNKDKENHVMIKLLISICAQQIKI